MNKYLVRFGNPNNDDSFEFYSRDSKRILQIFGKSRVFVFNKSGDKMLSAAARDENNNYFNIDVEPYNRQFARYGHF